MAQYEIRQGLLASRMAWNLKEGRDPLDGPLPPMKATDATL